MGRLTYKNYIEEYEVNFEKSSDKNWSIAESDDYIKVTGEPINKLGELEDVLEKYGIESAEDLDNIIHSIRTNTFIDIENKEILELENANLKNELAELKQTQKQLAIEEQDQDKISFAIEQLEKVKGLIANHTQELWTCEDDDIDVVLYEEIDNQIKELKGGK